MNTHRRINKAPKPPTPQQSVNRFRREMETAGFDVVVTVNDSPYAPRVDVQIWSKRERKQA